MIITEGTASLGFSSSPRLISQSKSTLNIKWETDAMSNGYYRTSTYPQIINEQDVFVKFTEGEQSSFNLILDELQNDKFYYFQSVNIVDGDTLLSEIELYSLASNSSGEIEVYFNNDIDRSISNGTFPHGATAAELEASILDKINAATASIDYCIYNTNRKSIVDALVAASERGVRIRVIYNEKSESSNQGFERSLPFNIVERKGDGLMHNKFLIIDVEDVDRSWVMSGSTNFTELQLDEDPNHTIFIQDQNLAKAYEIEFEEMWGSKSATPDASQAKFGVNKTDNTPHEFMVGGKLIELYFSPTDKVSQNINNALTSATKSIDAALLIFTKWETRDALEGELAEGTRFRAIVEDQENSDEIIGALTAKGATISGHPQETQMHHKYAIIDESLQNANSKVVTGSHNWTHSADIRHDENLLIIHDAEIANWFQQEWNARWAEQPTAVIDLEKSTRLISYPNPADDHVIMITDKKVNEYKIFDIRGALILRVDNDSNQKEQLLDISGLESGSYFIIGKNPNGDRSINTFIKI